MSNSTLELIILEHPQIIAILDDFYEKELSVKTISTRHNLTTKTVEHLIRTIKRNDDK